MSRWGYLSLSNTIEGCGWAFCRGTPDVSICRFSFFSGQDSPEYPSVSCMKREDWLPAFLDLCGRDSWACSQHLAIFRTMLVFEHSTHALNYTSQSIVQILSILNSGFFLGVGRTWIGGVDDLFLHQLLLRPLYFVTAIQPQF